MKGLLAIALVAAFALAGCAGSSDTTTSTTGKSTTSSTASSTSTGGTSTGSSTSTATSTSTSTSTSTGTGSPQEKPHTITFGANLRNGTAPLNVTFSLSATNVDAGTKWSISFGDGSTRNGTLLPASVTHQYTAAGTKTARANVTFGDGQRASSSLSIAVLPGTTTGGGGPLVNKTFSATIAVPNPVGSLSGFFCGLDDMADPAACFENQLRAARDNGGNKSFFVWYDVVVPAGAASMLVEGGSREAQTCQAIPAFGTVCSPDYDMVLIGPDGSVETVGTAAALESASVVSPAAGTWGIVVLYFAGPPNGASTTHILVQ